MNRLDKNMLLKMVEKYDKSSLDLVEKAYDYASKMHYGQKRKSGEDYIIHPLMVSYILSQMHADINTICAGLLHDTIEDTSATYEDIKNNFNEEIALLVNGVTNFEDINFHTKEEKNYANIRKIITSITSDPRIIIIKLADRLHNMRTLDYKEENKKILKARETMDIYVPLAGYIGAYHIKTELEDLSFKYLNPQKYYEVLENKYFFEEKHYKQFFEILEKVKNLLQKENISFFIKLRTKNIYGIYQKLEKGYQIDQIHDLVAIKIVLEDKISCYKTLGYLHEMFHPLNYKFKDYISMPKSNMYQSLHTTVFGPDNRLIQFQIRTYEMDNYNSFGLTGYWDKYKNNAKEDMLNDLKNHFEFFKIISILNEKYSNDKDFVLSVQNNLFSNIIYVYDENNNRYAMSKKSTLMDFINKINQDLVNINSVYVNNLYADINYELNNNDVIYISYNKDKIKTLKKRNEKY